MERFLLQGEPGRIVPYRLTSGQGERKRKAVKALQEEREGGNSASAEASPDARVMPTEEGRTTSMRTLCSVVYFTL